MPPFDRVPLTRHHLDSLDRPEVREAVLKFAEAIEPELRSYFEVSRRETPPDDR